MGDGAGEPDGIASDEGEDGIEPVEPPVVEDDVNASQSGVLTAGSFDDNLNLDVYQQFLSDVLQNDWVGTLSAISIGERIIIRVEDEQGEPVSDAQVVVTPDASADAQAASTMKFGP